jgi:Putative addiction module component
MTIDELRREALGLDLSSRASLARDLLSSLDDLSEAEIEQLWLEESVRRHEEVVSGAVENVAMDEALAKVRAARQ